MQTGAIAPDAVFPLPPSSPSPSPSLLPLSLPLSLPPSPRAGDALDDELLAGQRARLVKAADVNLARVRDAERLRAENDWTRGKRCMPGQDDSGIPPGRCGWTRLGLRVFWRASKDWFTANASCIGRSGGTTDVMMRMQSSTRLQRRRPIALPAVGPPKQQ